MNTNKKKEMMDQVPETCCYSCFYAKNEPCSCRCGGSNHGLGNPSNLPGTVNQLKLS